MTAGRIAAAASTALLFVVLLLSAAAAAVVESLAAPWDSLDLFSDSGGQRLPEADGEIPLRMYGLYHAAAAGCPGLPWTVLAGFGRAASDHGRQITDRGVMAISREQFDRYAEPVPASGAVPAFPLDPVDATFATARAICGSGPVLDVKSAVSRTVADPVAAVRIVELADVYSHAPAAGSFLGSAARSAPSSAARLAVEYAGAQLGRPYVWGGNGPDRSDGNGFDCSGLTQSAYQAAGIAIPRTATEQFHTGRAVDAPDLRAGDLVFYGDPNGFLHHVAIYLGRGIIIDAPHPGAVVRFDPVAGADYAGARRES
ncbi:C40 family peptidase [Catenulispora pinisilvae]|uniref:C40 family peptidase n=1 Tax=Catenulispora pinisilvae TaxID=2705253 RepID=UPI0018927502|nr:C40 family peptidase [Catenulispora pinisilvae]